ncbi:MAG TPA: hypothetical protein VNC50_10830 [Planctomycetia bacterium]|nr:hypothetical protein [Planctomycetia bacterium]
MRHPVSRIAGVAAAAALCVWAINSQPAGASFAEMIKPLVEAKSAKFRAVVTMDHQKEMTFTSSFLAPNKIRQENAEMISVIDMDAGKMLSLMPGIKQALLVEITGKKEGARSESYFGDLRKLLEEYRTKKSLALQDLGEKEIDGRKAFGFAFVQGGMTTEIWGDAKTHFLLRIEASASGPVKWKSTMSDFEFDAPIDPTKFALEAPADYKTIRTKVKAEPATEADFVAALKQLAERSDGELAAGLDGAAMGMTFAKAFMKEMKGDDAQEKLMQFATEVGRGLTFANALPAEADAHYAGGGVKTTGPKQPVFWYKPGGEGKYRVLSSDLTWSEQDAAPTAKNAVKLGGFPKAAYKKGTK